MRKSTAGRGSNAARSEFQMIAFTDSPRLERILWQYDPKGVTDPSHRQFHCDIITSYNMYFNCASCGTMTALLSAGPAVMRIDIPFLRVMSCGSAACQ